MSFLKVENGRRWINFFVVLASALLGYLSIRLTSFLGEFFDLEAKVPHFVLIGQFVGILIGLASLIFLFKSKRIMNYLNEVFVELTKVIWPDNESTVKLTIGIVIATALISGLFVVVDFIFSKLFSLFY